MRAAIVVFPGINRERDMAIALELATGQKPRMVWHKETTLDGIDLVVLPGGFSHGAAATALARRNRSSLTV